MCARAGEWGNTECVTTVWCISFPALVTVAVSLLWWFRCYGGSEGSWLLLVVRGEVLDHRCGLLGVLLVLLFRLSSRGSTYYSSRRLL